MVNMYIPRDKEKEREEYIIFRSSLELSRTIRFDSIG